MGSIPANPLPGYLASQAEFIVNNLEQTDYQFTENIDVDNGIYDCDCNGFVGFVLEGAAPAHYAIIDALKEPAQPRPRAFIYCDFFTSLTPESPGGWHRIESLIDARRGDIIAWRFPTIQEGEDTGHVCFVADTPAPDGSGAFIAVRVYDSADKPHFDDTRATGPFPNGVGSGFINFTVDGAGRPIAFQFAPPASAPFTYLEIAIGRVEPL